MILARPDGPRIALTVIGGFLGAGKTTLLNHLLHHAGGRRLAVLVNDFGAINVDRALVASTGVDAIELTNGCVCCSIGDDLTDTLIGLIGSAHPPEAIVIEASGVSDPWRIAQVGLADPALALDGVVVLVDATGFEQQHADPLLSDTLERQLRAADLLVINHCDRASVAGLQALRERLQALAPRTPRVETSRAAVPAALFGALFGAPSGAGHGEPCTGAACAHDHHHDEVQHDLQFETWLRADEHIHSAQALRAVLKDMPTGVMRLKGHVRTDEHGLAVLQFAGTHGSLRRAPPTDSAPALVAIGLRGRLPHAALQNAFDAARQTPPADTRPSA